MDSLTFVSRLIEVLIWPLVTLLVVFVLRKEIRSVIVTISKLKAGPVEAEFGNEVAKLRASTEGVDDLPPPEQLTPQKQILLQLAQINPRSAILEAWIGVEEALRQATASQGPFAPFPAPPPAMPPAWAPASGPSSSYSNNSGYESSSDSADYESSSSYDDYGSSSGSDECWPPPPFPPRPAVRKEDLLTQEELSLYRHLRGLRNQVAHASNLVPTPETALNYIELTSRLKRALAR